MHGVRGENSEEPRQMLKDYSATTRQRQAKESKIECETIQR